VERYCEQDEITLNGPRPLGVRRHEWRRCGRPAGSFNIADIKRKALAADSAILDDFGYAGADAWLAALLARSAEKGRTHIGSRALAKGAQSILICNRWQESCGALIQIS
jgi:hypothetical protein